MVTTIRVLYVVILVLAWAVSVFLSFDEESLMIFLLVFGVIAFIISAAAIQLDMHKRDESLEMPLLFPLLPMLLYISNPQSMQLQWISLFHFCAQFLFVVNVAGFFLGIALSPLLAKWFGARKTNALEISRAAWQELRASPVFIFALVLCVGVFTTLFFSAKILIVFIRLFGQWQQAFAYFSLFCGICFIIRLTFRSSRWGDPQPFHKK